MKKILYLITIAFSIFLFVQFGDDQNNLFSVNSNGEDYNEECQDEGCDTEETEELHENYESECFEESCLLEEVRETAGRRSSINAMMNDFTARGWTVSTCHRWGGCVAVPNVACLSPTYDNILAGMITQNSVDQHWSDFDFDKGDWDGGFGFADPTNPNLPLGRTFNAMNLLDLYGTSMPAGSDNWLPWFYSFSSNAIDEVDGKCDFGQTCGCTHARNYGGLNLDHRTELNWSFFYRLNVMNRASTIVHEARHADGKGHTSNCCINGGSCDSTWASNGAIRYQILYLWWLYHSGGDLVSTARRDTARIRANSLINRNFCTVPTRGDVFGSDTSNPNATFQISNYLGL